jgi:hypothetical protein
LDERVDERQTGGEGGGGGLISQGWHEKGGR